MKVMRKKKKGGKYRPPEVYYNLEKSIYANAASTGLAKFEKMRSFLKSTGGILANIKPNENGEVQFDISKFQGSF